jgi:hypothetical protein
MKKILPLLLLPFCWACKKSKDTDVISGIVWNKITNQPVPNQE